MEKAVGNVANEIVLTETGVGNLPTPREVRILYKNRKGEVSWRRVIPLSVTFDRSPGRPAPQWLLRAFDLDRDTERGFAMVDIWRWDVPAPAGLSPPAKEGGD